MKRSSTSVITFGSNLKSGSSCQASTTRAGGSQVSTLPHSLSLPSSHFWNQRPPTRGSMIASVSGEALTECERGHQRPKPAVKTSKARAGGALTRTLFRTGATVRVRDMGVFLGVWGRIESLHLRLERAERFVPELIEPAAQCTQAVRIDVVDAPRALGAIGHQARFLEHLQVLRDGGAAHRHAVGKLAHRARARAQLFEHLAAGGVGERRERGIVSHGLR